jgi:hypothetical protein
MTLTIPVSCPACPEVLRVPLVALHSGQGRALGVDPRVLEEHVDEHEEQK